VIEAPPQTLGRLITDQLLQSVLKHSFLWTLGRTIQPIAQPLSEQFMRRCRLLDGDNKRVADPMLVSANPHRPNSRSRARQLHRATLREPPRRG